jgi:hypothetical protein
MYIESIPNRNSPPCILLREDHREGKKVVKKTLANLTRWPTHVVDGLRLLIKGGAVAGLENGFEIARSLPHGHVATVLAVLKDLGLHRLLASRSSDTRNLVMATIAARITDPQSKLATARGLDDDTLFSSLAEECGLEALDEEDLYRAMDWLLDRQDRIEDKLASRHLQNGTFVFYDLTSTWYEGRTCPLAKRGHSRDKKKGLLQIEFGLLCDVEGRPVAVEVFEGNTGDPATYKKLSAVERAFRCLKTVDLNVRPIFHRLEKRVRAHVFLCMLAYYVEWEMCRRLAPMLFDDEDHEQAEQTRTSVVAPAERSARAKRKAASKQTDDGTPVHSFRTLLKDLATITKNRIQPNIPSSPCFTRIARPTHLQKSALNLLGVNL